MTKANFEFLADDPKGVDVEVPIRVLLVDDDSSVLLVAKWMLEQEGSFQVESVFSVKEAYALLEKKEFDVIVSDYQMPEKDGLEFLRELRVKGNNISFILFTGKSREDVAIRALNLGADHYVNKIGEPEMVYCELAHGILRAVEKKKSERMLVESEERYRILFENTSDFVCVVDKKGRVLSLNKSGTGFFGVRPEENVGKSILELFPKEFVFGFKRKMKNIFKTGRGLVSETSMIVGDKKMWISTNLSPIRDHEEKVVAVMGVTRDITEQKKSEEEVSYEKQFSLSLLGGLKEDFVVINPKRKHFLANAKSNKTQNIENEKNGKSTTIF